MFNLKFQCDQKKFRKIFEKTIFNPIAIKYKISLLSTHWNTLEIITQIIEILDKMIFLFTGIQLFTYKHIFRMNLMTCYTSGLSSSRVI